MTNTAALKELRDLHECQIETGNTTSARALEVAIAELEARIIISRIAPSAMKRRNSAKLIAAAGEAADFFEACDDTDANRLAKKLRTAIKGAA